MSFFLFQLFLISVLLNLLKKTFIYNFLFFMQQ